MLTCKVGQTDPVSGVRSRFISRSVHVRLQVSVCSSLFHSGNIQTDTQMSTHTHTKHYDELISKAQPAELINDNISSYFSTAS